MKRIIARTFLATLAFAVCGLLFYAVNQLVMLCLSNPASVLIGGAIALAYLLVLGGLFWCVEWALDTESKGGDDAK